MGGVVTIGACVGVVGGWWGGDHRRRVGGWGVVSWSVGGMARGHGTVSARACMGGWHGWMGGDVGGWLARWHVGARR